MSRSFPSEAGGAHALRALAAARQSEGRFGEAVSLFERAVTLSPGEPASWVALVECLSAARRPDEALAVCDSGLGHAPADVGLLCAKARVLHSLSRVADAAALFRLVLERDPACAAARYGLALQAVEAGQWQAAHAFVAPLMASSGANAELSWLAARIALGTGDLDAASASVDLALAHADLPTEQRAEALLLQGAILDRVGRFDAAFAAFAEGKSLLRAHFAERATGREAEADKYRRLAAWFAAADPTPWRHGATAPTRTTVHPRKREDPGLFRLPVQGHIFLLGFPRSGTTLLEQALAGHPGIANLEEAPTLAEATAEFLGSAAGLERLSRLGAAEADHWRSVYWREVGQGGAKPAGRVFVDKAPAGSLTLPLIAALFPTAKVLFALRDPRDVVLSCFRNNFQMNALTYAFTSLAAAAECYAACMAMVDVYRSVLALEIRQVRYETLVGDLEGELRAICRFLGVAFTPAMLDVSGTASGRSVRTPSAGQVRAGLNAEGVGRWRAYEQRLTPVLPALTPWVARFGYA